MVEPSERTLRVTIVVPAYDEAERLDPRAFLQFAAECDWLHSLFVNDGSRDLFAKMERECPAQIRARGFTENQGKAEAVRRSLLLALEAKPDLFGFWDAGAAKSVFGSDKVVFGQLAVGRSGGARLPSPVAAEATWGDQ